MNNTGLSILFECSGRRAPNECRWPELMIFFQQAITFGFYLASVVVVIVLIRTGFKMMTSGSPDELSEAKKSLAKVLWGFFWMLCAWLIVKYILKTFGVTEEYQLLTPQ